MVGPGIDVTPDRARPELVEYQAVRKQSINNARKVPIYGAKLEGSLVLGGKRLLGVEKPKAAFQFVTASSKI